MEEYVLEEMQRIDAEIAVIWEKKDDFSKLDKANARIYHNILVAMNSLSTTIYNSYGDYCWKKEENKDAFEEVKILYEKNKENLSYMINVLRERLKILDILNLMEKNQICMEDLSEKTGESLEDMQKIISRKKKADYETSKILSDIFHVPVDCFF